MRRVYSGLVMWLIYLALPFEEEMEEFRECEAAFGAASHQKRLKMVVYWVALRRGLIDLPPIEYQTCALCNF